MVQSSLISVARKQFHSDLLAGVLSTDSLGVSSNADKDNPLSVAMAQDIVSQLGSNRIGKKLAGQTLGSQFEIACQQFITSTFPQLKHLRPGTWTITRISSNDKLGISRYEQYQHLIDLTDIASHNTTLASAIGRDYIITPDIVIVREPELDETINGPEVLVDSSHALHSSLRRQNNSIPILHAGISCKWTMRSDRAQNARSEALNLIRNRKGHLPHVTVVTAEPLPSRIASLALGTGDIDCVYHFALPELQNAVQELGNDDSQELMNIMISGRRLRDISDLPLDLVT